MTDAAALPSPDFAQDVLAGGCRTAFVYAIVVRQLRRRGFLLPKPVAVTAATLAMVRLLRDLPGWD